MDNLELAGWLVAGIGVLFSLSALLLGASSLWHGLLSMLTGGLFGIAASQINWRARSNIYLVALSWLILLGAEWRFLGLPDRLFPEFLESPYHIWINLLLSGNDVSPQIYFGLKLLFILPLLHLDRQRRRVNRLPGEVKRELGLELW